MWPLFVLYYYNLRKNNAKPSEVGPQGYTKGIFSAHAPGQHIWASQGLTASAPKQRKLDGCVNCQQQITNSYFGGGKR